MSKNKIGPYWVNTSDNALVKQLLEKNDEKVLSDLNALFSGKDIEKVITDNIIFSDLDNLDTIWSLMLFSGYLTFSRCEISEITGVESYFLTIPNYEVRSFFKTSFVKEYSHGNSGTYFKMLEDLYKGDIEEFKHKFKNMYLSAVSYYDGADSEKYYHHFMLGFLVTLGDRYIITSNRESGYGRYDIALEPKDKKNFGMIFEFKIGTDETLIEKSKLALAQINEKRYDVSMRANGVSKVIKIGMAFSKKDVAIESIID